MTPETAHHDLHAITISEPMVILPADDYNELLVEAGYREVPELEQEVADADIRFQQGKAIPWEKFKSEISEI
jgi:hypothetical protein